MIRPTSWRTSVNQPPVERSSWIQDFIYGLVIRYTDWADRRRRP